MASSIAVTCGILLAMLQPGLQADSQGPAPAVGAVNIAQVFEAYQMTRDLEQRFESARRGISDEADNRRQAMENQMASLEAFDPASRDFAQRRDDLQRMRFEFKVWLEMEEQRLKEEHMAWLRQIYADVTDAVSEAARSRGIDLVVTVDELSEDVPDSLALRREILLKKVLYVSPRVDMTGQVLRLLNEKYEKKGGASWLQGQQAPVGRFLPAGGPTAPAPVPQR